MANISSYAIQYQGTIFADVDASGIDLLITEGAPLSRLNVAPQLTDAQVAALVGEGRIVAGYVNVSVTDDSRGYWNPDWTDNGLDWGKLQPSAPEWLKDRQLIDFAHTPKNITDDARIVEFYDPDWRANVIAQAVNLADRGYNGIFLDDVTRYHDLAKQSGQPPVKQLARDMVDLVAAVAAAVHEHHPGVQIIVNGDPYIGYVADGASYQAEFLNTIDAMLLDNLRDKDSGDAFIDFAHDHIGKTLLGVSSVDGQPSAAEYHGKGIVPYVTTDHAYHNFSPYAGPQTSGNDDIRGGDGPNLLYGLAGDDRLNGGAGADQLFGGDGNDIFIVDRAADRVFETAGQGSDTIFASSSFALAAGQSVELLATTLAAGTAAINLTGNEIAQHLNGNAGDNILNGGGGADTMAGFAGNDTYRVDNASDQVIEAISAVGSDTVFSSTSYTLAAGQSVEWLATSLVAGTAAITLTGNERAQVLNGNNGINGLLGGAGDDTIFGQGGNDVINAGFGRDLIDPGAGNDRIVYSNPVQSTSVTRDLIQTMNLNGADKFDFPAVPVSIHAAVTHGGLNTVHFDMNLTTAIGAAQLGAYQAVLFDPDAGDLNVAGHAFLIVDANGVAGYQAGEDYVVELANATGSLTADDFV